MRRAVTEHTDTGAHLLNVAMHLVTKFVYINLNLNLYSVTYNIIASPPFSVVNMI